MGVVDHGIFDGMTTAVIVAGKEVGFLPWFPLTSLSPFLPWFFTTCALINSCTNTTNRTALLFIDQGIRVAGQGGEKPWW